MNDLTFNQEEIKLIHDLLKLNSVQIVWDINAFYFNSNSVTYKLECFCATPAGSEYKYDEIFYCRFQKSNEYITFEENKTEYWYKIFNRGVKIVSIKYINVLELFPCNKVVSEQSTDPRDMGLNKSTLGLIIETDKGFLPSFILPSNYGFIWQPKIELYTKNEIEELLSENIPHYEMISCL